MDYLRPVYPYLILLSVVGILLPACESGPTIRRTDFAVHGIDISHHQRYINWDTVAAQPIDFVFAKATEGATHRDSLFAHNWKELSRVQLRRGAYHFYRPQTDPKKQAHHFIDCVELNYGDLPPMLDVEVLDGADKVQLISGLYTWLYMVEAHYNIKPILYTNLKFYNRYLAGHFKDYPLWIARYHDREPVLATARSWDFWQYGNRGQLNGITGDVDLNVYKGTVFELDELCWRPQAVLSTLDSH